jgi:hypothetical protein
VKQAKPSIRKYVKELISVVARMQKSYPSRRFTLDGRLVGDIGEILAEQIYDLKLFNGQHVKHDAKSRIGCVQIKATMKDRLTFGDIPEYYLGIKITSDGNVEEIFNGPGKIIGKATKHWRRPKSFLLPIPISTLKNLNKKVPDKNRIKKRRKP